MKKVALVPARAGTPSCTRVVFAVAIFEFIGYLVSKRDDLKMLT